MSAPACCCNMSNLFSVLVFRLGDASSAVMSACSRSSAVNAATASLVNPSAVGGVVFIILFQ